MGCLRTQSVNAVSRVTVDDAFVALVLMSPSTRRPSCAQSTASSSGRSPEHRMYLPSTLLRCAVYTDLLG